MSLTSGNKKNSIDSALFLSAPDKWGEIVMAMKPGAHLLLLNDIKTHHTGTIAAEDNGLEIRDTLAYVFADGENDAGMLLVTVARKPLDGTVAGNVLRWGIGGLNVDGCRVGTDDDLNGGRYSDNKQGNNGNSYGSGINKRSANDYVQPAGRWPANLILQDCPVVREMFPQSVSIASKRGGAKNKAGYKEGSGGGFSGEEPYECGYSDSGSASRFFYSAPTLNNLCSYLIKLVTPLNGTILTDYDTTTLPSNYIYVTK